MRVLMLMLMTSGACAAWATDTGSHDSGSSSSGGTGATETAIYDSGGHGASYLAKDPGGCACDAVGGSSGAAIAPLLGLLAWARRRSSAPFAP